MNKYVIVVVVIIALAGGVALGYGLNSSVSRLEPQVNNGIVQPEVGQDFNEDGKLTKNIPGQRGSLWHLLYQEGNGKTAIVELGFPGDAECVVAEIVKNCEEAELRVGDSVTISGKRKVENEIEVKRLVVVTSAPPLSAGAVPFQKSDTYGYFGTITLTGYYAQETHVCNPGEPCDETVEYGSFRFTNTDNQALTEYLKENVGNSFVAAQSIGLGCYQKDKSRIYSTNESDEGIVENAISGASLQKLLASSQAKPISLQVTKPIYTSGRGAPACYSHFRGFKVL